MSETIATTTTPRPPRQPDCRLTDQQLADLITRERPYKVFDGNSLFVLVTPSGQRSWRWRYYIRGRGKVLLLGSYIQMMARCNHPADRIESARVQTAAHKNSRLVMRPAKGLLIEKLGLVSQGRVERISEWIRQHGDYAQLQITLNDILGRLAFGVKAENSSKLLTNLAAPSDSRGRGRTSNGKRALTTSGPWTT